MSRITRGHCSNSSLSASFLFWCGITFLGSEVREVCLCVRTHGFSRIFCIPNNWHGFITTRWYSSDPLLCCKILQEKACALPPRILFVRDVLLQHSFDFPKDQSDDGKIAACHTQAVVEDWHCYTVPLSTVQTRSPLPFPELLTTFLVQCFRRLLPVVTLKLPVLTSSSISASSLWRCPRLVDFMRAFPAFMEELLAWLNESVDASVLCSWDVVNILSDAIHSV